MTTRTQQAKSQAADFSVDSCCCCRYSFPALTAVLLQRGAKSMVTGFLFVLLRYFGHERTSNYCCTSNETENINLAPHPSLYSPENSAHNPEHSRSTFLTETRKKISNNNRPLTHRHTGKISDPCPITSTMIYVADLNGTDPPPTKRNRHMDRDPTTRRLSS